VIRWASGLIAKASIRDSAVNQRLGQVTTMLAHPSALTRPGFLLRATGRRRPRLSGRRRCG
jgi:hypothetical protein